MPSPARQRRAPGEIKLDGHVYRFGLFSATLALRVQFWLTEALTDSGDGSHPPADEFLAYITCDGGPALRLPPEHVDKVLSGLIAYNFAEFEPAPRRKAARR